ncbi:hypothetical protein MKW98_014680, partial [Papaver atlanticum]
RANKKGKGPSIVVEVPGSDEDIEDAAESSTKCDMEEDFEKVPEGVDESGGDNLRDDAGFFQDDTPVTEPTSESVPKVSASAVPISIVMQPFSSTDAMVISIIAAATSVEAEIPQGSAGSFSRFPSAAFGSTSSAKATSQAKTVSISLKEFSFNIASPALGSSQSISTAPTGKSTVVPPSSPDWAGLDAFKAAGDMELREGSEKVPLASQTYVSSSPIVPLFGDTLCILVSLPLGTSSCTSVIGSSSNVLRDEAMFIGGQASGGADEALFKAIVRDSRSPFASILAPYQAESSQEAANNMNTLMSHFNLNKELFLDPDYFRACQGFRELRRGSLQEMEAFMDSYVEFLPRLSMFS